MGFKKIIKKVFGDDFISSDELHVPKDDWIEIKIGVSVGFEHLINIKKFLNEYAEELIWVLEVGSESRIEIEGKVHSNVEVSISPPNKHISPDDLMEDSNKIGNFNFAIFRDLVCDGDEKKAVDGFTRNMGVSCSVIEDKSPEKDSFYLNQTTGFLNLQYRLIDRMKYEKKNEKKAIELFGDTVLNDLRALFKDENEDIPKKSKKKKKDKKNKGKGMLGDDDEGPINEEIDIGDVHINLKRDLNKVFGFNL